MDPKSNSNCIPFIPEEFMHYYRARAEARAIKDCIRLMGLPYEAQHEHVLYFLQPYHQKIIPYGVHMVVTEGQSKGEAFIQMNSEESAFITAQQKHRRYMIFDNEEHCIEVIQCSFDDMNGILITGDMTTRYDRLTGADPVLPWCKESLPHESHLT